MRKVRCRVMKWAGSSVWGRGWVGRLRSGVGLKWRGLFQQGARVRVWLMAGTKWYGTSVEAMGRSVGRADGWG